MSVDLDPDVLSGGVYGAEYALARQGLNPQRMNVDAVARAVLVNAMSGGRLMPRADFDAEVRRWKEKARLASASRAAIQVQHDNYVVRVRDAIELAMAAGLIDTEVGAELAKDCGVCITAPPTSPT